jgi:hypothetical protein
MEDFGIVHCPHKFGPKGEIGLIESEREYDNVYEYFPNK